MKKIFLYSLALIAILSLTIYSCSSDSSNPVTTLTYDANSINGTITFVDTNFIRDTVNGYYNVSAFASWPPTSNATASAKIKPVFSNGKYTATFKIIIPGSITNGSFTITSAFVKVPYVPGQSVLGLGMYEIAGRDTLHNDSILFQTPHPKAVITNGAGIGNIDFNSWIDTTKKLYKF